MSRFGYPSMVHADAVAVTLSPKLRISKREGGGGGGHSISPVRASSSSWLTAPDEGRDVDVGVCGDPVHRRRAARSSAILADNQNHRRDLGRAPKTVNSELSVLRQLLKRAKLWYRFGEDYKPPKNTKPALGQALTDDEQARPFEMRKLGPALDCRGGAASLIGMMAGASQAGVRSWTLRGLGRFSWEESRSVLDSSLSPARAVGGRVAAALRAAPAP